MALLLTSGDLEDQPKPKRPRGAGAVQNLSDSQAAADEVQPDSQKFAEVLSVEATVSNVVNEKEQSVLGTQASVDNCD